METKSVGLTISTDAFCALRDFGGFSIRRWMSKDDAKLTIAALRSEQDSSLIFPKGKWATIQALEADYIRDTGEQP